MAAGDFSATTLCDIMVEEANLVATSRTSEMATSIVAGQSVFNHQDPRLDVLSSGNGVGQRCVSASAYAIRTCDITASETLTVSCDVGTQTEAQSEALPLDKEILAKIGFRVLDNQCNNAVTFENLMARNMMNAKAKLEVALSKKAVAVLNANRDTADISWFSTPGSVNAKTFEVSSTNFKSDLLADIRFAGAYTKANDLMILNGSNFFNEQFLALYKGSACCDNDAVLNGNYFNIAFDVHNVDTTTGGKSTFAFDRNALISWSAPDHKVTELPTPILMSSDTYLYWDTLPRLTYTANGQQHPWYVDVRMKRLCSGSGVASLAYGWDVELVVRGVIKPNLKNCDGFAGIIRIDKVTGG